MARPIASPPHCEAALAYQSKAGEGLEKKRFKILEQMAECFETNLADTQKEEMQNQKAYDELKAANEGEITAGQEQIDAKTQELATIDEKIAESKEDLEDTRASALCRRGIPHDVEGEVLHH